MADRVQNGATTAQRPRTSDGRSGPPDLGYGEVKACPCGRPVPPTPPHQRGRRRQLCSRCRQTRRALSYIRAGERILEQLHDPEWDGAPR